MMLVCNSVVGFPDDVGCDSIVGVPDDVGCDSVVGVPDDFCDSDVPDCCADRCWQRCTKVLYCR